MATSVSATQQAQPASHDVRAFADEAREALTQSIHAANLTGDPLRPVLEAQLLTLEAQDRIAERTEAAAQRIEQASQSQTLSDPQLRELARTIAPQLVHGLKSD